jgi:hypothetical protein
LHRFHSRACCLLLKFGESMADSERQSVFCENAYFAIRRRCSVSSAGLQPPGARRHEPRAQPHSLRELYQEGRSWCVDYVNLPELSLPVCRRPRRAPKCLLKTIMKTGRRCALTHACERLHATDPIVPPTQDWTKATRRSRWSREHDKWRDAQPTPVRRKPPQEL